MYNSIKTAKLERVIAFLQSEGIFANTLDLTPEQYDSLRSNIKSIVPDVNIDFVEKNGVVCCHIQSESLDIRVCSNLGGRTGKTNNEQRAYRRFCKAAYENYSNLAIQRNAVPTAPSIVFELEHHNWGLSGPRDWSSEKWVLYDNNWIEKKRFYRDERGAGVRLFESNSTRFSKEKMESLIDLINIAKANDTYVDAYDGDAWKFSYYENNNVLWKRETGYIYGIEPLEKITELFDMESIVTPPKERFGEKPIPKKIKDIYQQAISKLFGDVTLLTSDEISALKGMCNRCIKHDQSDWRTTYCMIGSPERTILKRYVDEIVSIRDDVRLGNYSNVIAFRDKYYEIFKNTYEELCGSLSEKCVEVARNSSKQSKMEVIVENDISVQEQIENIEKSVNSFSPDKN